MIIALFIAVVYLGAAQEITVRLNIFHLAGLLVFDSRKVITGHRRQFFNLFGIGIITLLDLHTRKTQSREFRTIHFRLEFARRFIRIEGTLKLQSLRDLHLGKFHYLIAATVIYTLEAHKRNRYLGGIAILIVLPAETAQKRTITGTISIPAPFKGSAKNASARITVLILAPASDTEYITADSTVFLQTKVQFAAQIDTESALTILIPAEYKQTAHPAGGNLMPVRPGHILIFFLGSTCSTALIVRCFSAALVCALAAGAFRSAGFSFLFLLVLICLTLCIRLRCIGLVGFLGFAHLLGTVGYLSSAAAAATTLAAFKFSTASGTSRFLTIKLIAAFLSVFFTALFAFSFVSFAVLAFSVFSFTAECFLQITLRALFTFLFLSAAET